MSLKRVSHFAGAEWERNCLQEYRCPTTGDCRSGSAERFWTATICRGQGAGGVGVHDRRLHRAHAPPSAQLTQLADKIAHRPARIARCSRVTARRARCRRRNKEDNTERPRTRRAMLGPLSATGGNGRERPCRTPVQPAKRSPMTPQPRPSRAKPTLALPLAAGQTARKGHLNYLYLDTRRELVCTHRFRHHAIDRRDFCFGIMAFNAIRHTGAGDDH